MKIKWNSEQLPVAVERYNAIAEALNKAAPEVRDILSGAKITAANVGKRERDKVAEIMDAVMPSEKWARWWLDTQYTYTVYLCADFFAHAGGCSVDYLKLSLAVAEKEGDYWKPAQPIALETLTVAEIAQRVEDAEKAEKTAQAAKDAFCAAKSKLAGFIHD